MTIARRERKERVETDEQEGLLFETYADRVYRYALRRVKVAAVAEDIAAEVFSEVYRRPSRVPTEAAQAWLLGIARRKIADYYRKANVRSEVPLNEAITADEPLGFGALIEGERQRQLQALVNSLPSDQREALLLFYVEDLSPAEIAITLRRSRFAVNSLLQRARKRIYELGRDYFDEGREKC